MMLSIRSPKPPATGQRATIPGSVVPAPIYGVTSTTEVLILARKAESGRLENPHDREFFEKQDTGRNSANCGGSPFGETCRLCFAAGCHFPTSNRNKRRVR